MGRFHQALMLWMNQRWWWFLVYCMYNSFELPFFTKFLFIYVVREFVTWETANESNSNSRLSNCLDDDIFACRLLIVTRSRIDFVSFQSLNKEIICFFNLWIAQWILSYNMWSYLEEHVILHRRTKEQQLLLLPISFRIKDNEFVLSWR